jgi:hypothetical protein
VGVSWCTKAKQKREKENSNTLFKPWEPPTLAHSPKTVLCSAVPVFPEKHNAFFLPVQCSHLHLFPYSIVCKMRDPHFVVRIVLGAILATILGFFALEAEHAPPLITTVGVSGGASSSLGAPVHRIDVAAPPPAPPDIASDQPLPGQWRGDGTYPPPGRGMFHVPNSTTPDTWILPLSGQLSDPTPPSRPRRPAVTRGPSPPLPTTFTWGLLTEAGKVRLRLLADGSLLSVDWESARSCLRGRSLAFVGDSVTRYQFMNLLYFVSTGSWYSPVPTNENERQWNNWTAYYQQSAARHSSSTAHDICDCYREPIVNEGKSIDNRYFHDSVADVSLAYVQMWGFRHVHGHDQEWLNATCDTPPCKQSGCHAGHCSSDVEPYHWMAWSPGGVIDWIAHSVAPDTIVINSGLWATYDDDETPANTLLAASIRARRKGVQNFYWKTTTARHEDNPLWGFLPERAYIIPTLTEGPEERQWRILPAFEMTIELQRLVHAGAIPLDWAMWDSLHYDQQVYRGLNEVFLHSELHGCDGAVRLVPATINETTLEIYITA